MTLKRTDIPWRELPHLRIEEAAEIAGVSRRTVANAIEQNFLEVRRLGHVPVIATATTPAGSPTYRLIEFYVEAHNEEMPHSTFQGQTPNEMFFGTGDEVTKKLAAARKIAREERMETNLAPRCGVCVGETESSALLLQRARSRMS